MSTPQRETVTVCLPVFNCAQYIRAAVESVLAQDYPDWTLLISDNASTDGTWEILNALSHPRIKLHRQPQNLGVVANWNYLLEQAATEFVCFLGADDYFYPDHLRRKVDLLRKFPEVPFAHGPVDFVDEVGKPLKRLEGASESGITPLKRGVNEREAAADAGAARAGAIGGSGFEPAKGSLRRLLQINHINITSVMFRRQALVESGLRFDSRLRFFIDWQLYVELMLRYPGAAWDNQATAAYRVHAASDARQNVRSARWALESRQFFLASFQERAADWSRLGFDSLTEGRRMTADLWALAFQQWRRGNKVEAREAWSMFRKFHGFGTVAKGLGPWLGRGIRGNSQNG